MTSACVVVIASVLLGGPATVPAENRARSLRLNEEGWRLFQARHQADAEEVFAQAVELDPSNGAAWNGLGWSRFNQGKRAEAEQAFSTCIELDPNAPAALNGLGWIRFQERDYDTAEKLWLKSNAPAGWIGLAQVYLLKEQWDEAAKWAEKCVNTGAGEFAEKLLAAAKARELPDELKKRIEPSARGPGSDETDLGWQLFQRGRFEEAQTAFERALAHAPEDMSAHNGLGFCLLNLGDAAEAKVHFQMCLDADETAAGPMNGMARCLMIEGKKDEAIALWEKSNRLYPGATAATYGLAFAYYEDDQFEKALPYLEELARHDPENEHILTALERTRKALGK